jgi:hypothetical protein
MADTRSTVAGGAEGLDWFRNPTRWNEEHGTPLVRHESLPCIRGIQDEYSKGGEFEEEGLDEM